MQRLQSIYVLLAGVFRRQREWLIRSLQLALIVVSGLTGFLLRFEFSVPHEVMTAAWYGIGVWICVKVPVFHVFRMSRGVWRYFSTPDLVRVCAANLVASSISAAVLLLSPLAIPRSILVVDFLVCFLLTTGIRAGTRLFLEVANTGRGQERQRTFIYGAGRAGILLYREARGNPDFPNRICGFIDDNPAKHGKLIHGLQVWGGGSDLPHLALRHQIAEVLIAIPSATGTQMTRVIRCCHNAGVAFRTMPAISQIIAGHRLAPQIREVAVEDVLGRRAVELDHGRIRSRLEGRVALVTGAAGSIGSELCRQIARFRPAALVAFEVAETALFELEQEMKDRFPEVKFFPEIGSVQNAQRVRDVFEFHRPAAVYHAAAYKHVPMMEAHAFEAVENNIIGTFNVATIAADCGVQDFVMISSDKAVRPTNVMGATKRVAELVIRSLQNGGPRYISVRFGNVLGSNGSVVPIFKRQIASGGPVRVTHPEMRRYFMTIPEASQLVLQASTMGKGGEIYVLDMGQPVRIADLAKQLILLSGLRPDEDIRIEYTGVRPGEKFFEELNIEDEQVLPTYHEKIKIFSGIGLPSEKALQHLAALRGACERRDLGALVLELKDMVPDYNPSRELLQGIFSPGLARLAAAVESGAAAPEPAAIPAGITVPAGN